VFALAAFAFGALSTCPAQDEPSYHLPPAERTSVQDALDRAAKWLIAQQRPSGAFGSPATGGSRVPELPLTAMALWALAGAAEDDRHDAVCSAAARALLSKQQADGGIYEPRAGLVRYTAAVASRALRAWRDTLLARGDPEAAARRLKADFGERHEASLQRLSLFVYRNRDLESYEEARARTPPGETAAAVEKLRAREDLPANVRRAVDFLRRSSRDPTDRKIRWRPPQIGGGDAAVSYDQLLRYVGESTRRDNPTVSRAYWAIRTHYTVRENPDLTQRYAPSSGYLHRDAGLYYYYLTLARTLSAMGRPRLETVAGRSHDWARELSERLRGLQRPDGTWRNDNARWWEDDPALTTCYAIISLSLCRDLRTKVPRR